MPITPDPNRPAFEPDPTIRQEGEMSLPPVTDDNTPPAAPVIPATATEDAPFKTFKTEEEYNAFVTEQKKAALPTTPEPEPEPKVEDLVLYKGHRDPETGQWVGEAPADWNDFYRKLLTDPQTRKVLAKTMSKEVVAEIKTMTDSERAEMDKINKEFDAEYTAIAKKGLVPDLSTKEGQVINQQISLVGATYGLTSITKAYDLWSKLPVENGGGFGYKPQSSAQDSRRDKAALIGGGRKVSGASTEKPRNYEDIHTKSLDQLVQERTKE
jgi:hypothetical protein